MNSSQWATRAAITDPRILILDEATSNVDVQTEAKIEHGLRRLLAGRTAIVIAHRLSTIRSAGRILVMEHGRIAEQGTHEQLMAHAGLYAWMWRAQAREDARHPKPAVRTGAFTAAPLTAEWRRTLVPAQEIPR